MDDRLSLPQARRIALAAQGFAAARPTGRIDRRHLRKVLDRIRLVQIDSVNVVVRSHELPLFARLGPHPRDALVAATHRGELFEYWGHEASFIPVELHPLLRHKMARGHESAWGGLVRLAKEQPQLIEAVFDEVAARGPISAGELSMGGGRTGPWWGWTNAKAAVEYLFWCGRVTARRRPNFEREYALPEQLIPAAVLARPTPDEDDARRDLLVLAADALGVATAKDLADYFRLNVPRARPLLDELVEDGRLVPVRVDGWKDRAYLHPDARSPRKVRARALLSPFDSLVWERSRTERLWDFRYRLELYTPAPKRTYGYYVLPFLLGEHLVARVDVKSDRVNGRLLVHAAYAEHGPGHPPPAHVATELSAELHELAAFLGLGNGVTVAVPTKGDLAPELSDAVAAAG